VSRSREPRDSRGAASAAPLRALLLAGLLAAVLAALPAAAGAAERQLPCGIATVVDDLFRCRQQPVPPPATDAQSAPSSTLPEQQPRATPDGPRFVPDRLLVRFQPAISRSREDAELARAGADPVARIDPLHVVVAHVEPEQRDAALDRLRDSDAVAGVEKDAVLEAVAATPNDEDWSAQWGLRRVGFPNAWDAARAAAPIVVAVLDTGVDAAHPDLKGAVLTGVSLVGSAGDDNGHGTAVAGIIAARTDNREGIAGVCAVCSILPVKVLAADGTGDTGLVAAGIVRAVDAGARVISMSLGGPVADGTLAQAVSYALGKDVVLVAAAGNKGTSTPFYPAAIPGVVGVAGTDENDHLYSWSNYGSWVQLAAPGCNAAPALAGGYEVFCGTSSATPLVAGLLALRLSEQSTGGSAAAIDALERTATPIGDVVRHGRVDATTALALGPVAPAVPVTSAPTRLFAVKGVVTPRVRSIAYRYSTDATGVTASLTFAGASRLELSIRTPAGAVVGRVSGASPLRLTRRLRPGTFVVVVSARRTRTHFTLVVMGQ